MGEWWQDRTYRSLEIQRIRGDEMYEVGKDREKRGDDRGKPEEKEKAAEERQ